MTIDEVVDRAMAFIEKDQFSEKWIYTSKLFYKNKLLPLFTDKKEFDSKIIIHLIDEYTSMLLNRTLYQRKIKKNCKIKKPMDGALCRIQLHNVPSFIWLYRSYGL